MDIRPLEEETRYTPELGCQRVVERFTVAITNNALLLSDVKTCGMAFFLAICMFPHLQSAFGFNTWWRYRASERIDPPGASNIGDQLLPQTLSRAIKIIVTTQGHECLFDLVIAQ